MSIAGSNASVEANELTPQEATVVFDRIAHDALDLSGEAFLAALDEGSSTTSTPTRILGCSTCSWHCLSFADA